MLSRPEIRPSDFHQGEYVAHVDGATFRVRRVVGALEQWIAATSSSPPIATGYQLESHWIFPSALDSPDPRPVEPSASALNTWREKCTNLLLPSLSPRP